MKQFPRLYYTLKRLYTRSVYTLVNYTIFLRYNELLFIFIFFVTAMFSFIVQCLASNCEKMAAIAALEDSNTVVETSLKMLAGTWISEGYVVY